MNNSISRHIASLAPKGKSPVKPAPRKAASKPAPVPKGKKTKIVEEVADAGSADEPTNKRRRATSNASSGPPKKITKAAQKAKEVQAKKALGKGDFTIFIYVPYSLSLSVQTH